MAKVILITHQKGGVGKSTIAYNLAVNIRNNVKVAIIDLDPQGSLIQLSDIAPIDILPADSIDTLDELDYDFIYIDTPPYISDRLPELCKIADLILVPMKPGVLDLLAVKNTIEIIKKAGKEDNTMVVLNLAKSNTTLTQDIKKELQEYNITIADTILSDLVAFTRSVVLNGVDNDIKAQSLIDSLTGEVIQNII